MANEFLIVPAPNLGRPIVRGSKSIIRRERRVTFDPARGYSTTTEYESVDEKALAATLQNADKAGVAYDLTLTGKKSRLLVSSSESQDGSPNSPVDTWQLLANESQRDIKEHPSVLLIDPELLAQVVQAAHDFEEGEVADFSAETEDDELNEKLTALFFLMTHGVTSYETINYVLRHTTNVSNRYDTNISDSNVGRVYGTSGLTAETQDIGLWTYPMPGRLAAKIAAIPDPDLTGLGNILDWGWLKRASTETTSANYRIDISTEYWLGAWSKLLYPAVG
jgi:hypothetical protein